MFFVLCREPPLFFRITVAGNFLWKPIAKGQCCSSGAVCVGEDRRFPDWACMEQCKASSALMPGDFLGKHKEDMAHWDEGKSSYHVPVRRGALWGLTSLQVEGWQLPSRDSNSTRMSYFANQLMSFLWHWGQPIWWPWWSAGVEQAVGLQFFVWPYKCSKQAWLGEPHQGLWETSVQGVQPSWIHTGSTSVSSSHASVHIWNEWHGDLRRNRP